MDSRRFDALTKSLIAPNTRRGLLGTLAAVGAVLAGAHSAEQANAQVSQAQCGNKICAANPAVCTDGCVCCIYTNGNSRRRPHLGGWTASRCQATPKVHQALRRIPAPTTTTTTTTSAPTTTTTSTTTTPAPSICTIKDLACASYFDVCSGADCFCRPSPRA